MKRKENRYRAARRLSGICLLACLVVFLVLRTAALQAEIMTEEEVRRAAETYARTISRDARDDAFVADMEPYVIDGEVVAYIAHLDGGGYCLCGVDDLVLPVYLYVPEGTYDPENPANECILWEIGERTALYRSWVREGNVEFQSRTQAILERKSFWGDLVTGSVPARVIANKESFIEADKLKQPAAPAVEPAVMALHLTSLWHQGHPFYDMCPTLPPGSDNRCVVGCVATAMAQVMYYWKWPTTGQSSNDLFYHYRYWMFGWKELPLAIDPQLYDTGGWSWYGRLQWTPDEGGKLRMSGFWDWSILATAHDTTFVKNITPEYLTTVDSLYGEINHDSTYHAANFAATTYDWSLMQDWHGDPPDPGDDEVAKLSYHVGIAINMDYGLRGSSSNANHFTNGLESYFRYDPDVFYAIPNIYSISTEITWLRPVGIGGCQHMWVILGYDKSTDPDRLFLRNMGWGGSGNGWYTVDDWCYIGDTEAVFWIAPIDGVKFVGDTDPGDGSPNDPFISLSEALATVPDGTTLIFRAGSDNPYPGTELIINRPLTLMGEDATIYLE